MTKIRPILAASLLVASLAVAAATPASADAVSELTGCTARATTPRYSNGAITGSGFGSCPGGVPIEVQVCLDYAQVPLACATYHGNGSAGGPVSRDGCLDGVWQTFVTVRSPFFPVVRVHSAPTLILCPIQT